MKINEIVGLSMIVKNEQNILARCLDSYAGTYDELKHVLLPEIDIVQKNLSETVNDFTKAFLLFIIINIKEFQLFNIILT